MIDQAEALKVVMKRVGDFFNKLKPEEIEALARGEGAIRFVPGGWKLTPPPPPPPPVERVDADEVRAELRLALNKAAATAYLKGRKLTVPQLKLLCEDLDLAAPATGPKIIAEIVNQYVGGRDLAAAARRA